MCVTAATGSKVVLPFAEKLEQFEIFCLVVDVLFLGRSFLGGRLGGGVGTGLGGRSGLACHECAKTHKAGCKGQDRADFHGGSFPFCGKMSHYTIPLPPLTIGNAKFTITKLHEKYA
jgi:hypothetical protein